MSSGTGLQGSASGSISRMYSNRFVSHGFDDIESGDADLSDALSELLDKGPKEGEIIEGTVICMDGGYITVDAGLKSEGVVSLREFELGDGGQDVEVGSKVKLCLEKIEGKSGSVVLSREGNKRRIMAKARKGRGREN